MYHYIDTAIDSIQTAKRQFLHAFVYDQKYLAPWNAYLDTQTAFVKQAAKTACDVGSAVKRDLTDLRKTWK